MTDSPPKSAPYKDHESRVPATPPEEIPIEIVSDDEMALLETALAAAVAGKALFPPLFQRSARSIKSISALAKGRLLGGSESDLEDSGNCNGGSTAKNGDEASPSLLDRFRKKGLSVTDITGTEWCEKQMEFVLHSGKRRTTKAMKAGSARHEKLEQEVVQKVSIHAKSDEDRWALRLMNFITGAHQLLSEGLTRELPIWCFLEGIGVKGVIDEVRMPVNGNERNPILVDIKTRVRNSLPAGPQRRNGRFQLMCYKHMWDKAVSKNFPTEQFFEYYNLNPRRILSEDIREHAANAGLPAEVVRGFTDLAKIHLSLKRHVQRQNLEEILRYYRNTCRKLLVAHSQLLLRYELQKDHSVIGEDQFTYDPDWVKDQLRTCLELWLGEREAKFIPEEERWKCSVCEYASACPVRDIDDAASRSVDSRQGST